MIEFNSVWLVSLILYLLSIFFILLIPKFFFKPIDQYSFSIRRIFPFEVVNNLGNKYNLYKIVLFIFSALCFSPIFLISSTNEMFGELSFFIILNGCLFGLSGICFVFLHFFNPSSVKVHSLIVTIFVSLTFLSGLISSIFSINIYSLNYKFGDVAIINIIFGLICFVAAIFLLTNALNSKIKQWGKLDLITEKDNQFVRPKVFPLAYLEWLSFLILFIEEICLFFIVLIY